MAKEALTPQTIVPAHIALILDGNRRFAASKGMLKYLGHDAGAQVLRTILPHLAKKGISTLTLYVFSTENFARDQVEQDHLFELFVKYFADKKTMDEFIEHDASIAFIGDMSRFPIAVQDAAKSAAEATKSCRKLIVNFAMGYGGRDEILHAVKEIAASVALKQIHIPDITFETIRQHLWLKSEPDLIIRTVGTHPTSNFLPWQSIYSEWFFLDKFWPQITTRDIDSILEQFAQRKRNFGK